MLPVSLFCSDWDVEPSTVAQPALLGGSTAPSMVDINNAGPSLMRLLGDGKNYEAAPLPDISFAKGKLKRKWHVSDE